MYNDAILGELINDDNAIMETGHIPEDLRE